MTIVNVITKSKTMAKRQKKKMVKLKNIKRKDNVKLEMCRILIWPNIRLIGYNTSSTIAFILHIEVEMCRILIWPNIRLIGYNTSS